MKRVPILPTLLVLVAVAIMLRLGVWQIDRLHQKQALVARYQAALAGYEKLRAGPPVDLAAAPVGQVIAHVRVTCARLSDPRAVADRNTYGEVGFGHIARCDYAPAPGAPANRSVTLLLGWSRTPAEARWQPGPVSGMLFAPTAASTRLIADPPLAGLAVSGRPDPDSIPNNHLAYAVQWFLFAMTALVIYAIALRKRLKG